MADHCDATMLLAAWVSGVFDTARHGPSPNTLYRKARFQRLIKTPTIGDTTVFYQPHTFPATSANHSRLHFSVALSVHLPL